MKALNIRKSLLIKKKNTEFFKKMGTSPTSYTNYKFRKQEKETFEIMSRQWPDFDKLSKMQSDRQKIEAKTLNALQRAKMRGFISHGISSTVANHNILKRDEPAVQEQTFDKGDKNVNIAFETP